MEKNQPATTIKQPAKKAAIYPAYFHREFPQDSSAEKGVLSSALLCPNEVVELATESGITSESFYIPAHGEIWTAITAILANGGIVDFITLANHLRDRNKFDHVGGASALNDLFVYLPTAANAGYYIEIVLEKQTLRRIITTCNEFAGRAYEEQAEVVALLDEFETRSGKVRLNAASQILSAREAIMQTVAALERRFESKGALGGISTGFRQLDTMCDGLHDAEMFVIAARPSMGKTAFMLNMVEHIAVELKLPVHVFSLEMSSQQLYERLLLARARVNMARVRNGFMSERDFPAIMAAASTLAAANIWVDDTSSISIQEMRAKARRMKREKGTRAIFMDYVQLGTSKSGRRYERRDLEIGEISAGCKAMAKELGIPVVVLAQLNRKPEERTGGRPRMSDLRECGSIEQDADLVGLLHRDEYYAEGEEEKAEAMGKATLIIAKQRNGPTGDVPITFIGEYARFEDRAENIG